MDISTLTPLETAGLDAMAARKGATAQAVADQSEAALRATLEAAARQTQVNAWEATGPAPGAPAPDPEPLSADDEAHIAATMPQTFAHWAEALLSPAEIGAITGVSDAERAAAIVLSAADFYVALATSAVIDMGDATDPETWLVAQIDASPLDAATQTVARILARKATHFHRADPERPGLMEAIAAILPRADGGVGMTAAEIDALFLTASGAGATP